MTKLYMVVLAILLLPATTWAQSTITGRVTATDEPNGLPGATVAIPGTTRGVSTSADGTFSLPLQEGDTAVNISFIGYISQTVSIVGKMSVDVELQPEIREAEEVVVVGYGTQRKNDLTGAVGSLRGQDLVKIPASNPVQALVGKATGVQVQANSGQPGDGSTVRIRGIGTLSAGADGPLYVVDGVFMDNINAINAQDIESIELLKDASSAAIFGIRGANGVILVTTRKGKSGKPRFSFTAEYSQQSNTKHINMLNGHEYAQIYSGFTGNPINNIDAIPQTDWQAETFRKASVTWYKPWEFFTQNTTPIHNYQFSASGGTDKGTYYLGVGYFKQEGLVPNSNYERLSVRFNNDYNLTKWLKVGQNLAITPNQQRLGSTAAVQRAYWADPSVSPRLNPAHGDTIYTAVNTGNPLGEINYSSNTYNKRLNAVGNVFAEVTLPFGFKYRWNAGIDINSNRAVGFVPSYFISPTQSNTLASLTSDREWTDNLLMDNLLYWNKSYGKHNFDAFAGVSVYSYYNELLQTSANNLVSTDPNDWYLNAGTSLSSQEKALSRHQLSYLGRVNYNYDGRYLLTLTNRLDGSSLFDAQRRYANFPSAALGWVVSREAFMQEVSAISNLKIRASAGRLGNQAVASEYQLARFALIDPRTPAVFGQSNTFTQGVSVSKTANRNLGWETTTQLDGGLEVGLLKNRLTFEGDYYYRQSDNILVPLTTPGYFGNGSGQRILYNAASVLNKGVEFNVNWKDQIGKVGYRVGVLGTTVNNKVLSMGNNVPADSSLPDGSGAQGKITNTTVGQPIGVFYGYKTDGIYQTEQEAQTQPSTGDAHAGDLRYKDLNGDKRINGSDRTYLGSPIPKFIYGFSAGVNYGGFDLQLDFQGQTGNMIYNDKATNRFGAANFEAQARDAWTPTHTNTSVPRLTQGGSNYAVSDFWLQKGDYLRLRSARLSYTLPQGFTTRLMLEQASIYLQGTNLLTWTPYTGYTPEITGTSQLANGIDSGVYPVARVVTVGVNVTF